MHRVENVAAMRSVWRDRGSAWSGGREESRTLARLYCFVVVEHAGRRMHVLGVSRVAQQAKKLILGLGDRAGGFKFLIRDRDAKFTAMFDKVIRAEAIRIVLTAPPAPRMNAIMERWVGSVRRELLDLSLIMNAHHAAANTASTAVARTTGFHLTGDPPLTLTLTDARDPLLTWRHHRSTRQNP